MVTLSMFETLVMAGCRAAKLREHALGLRATSSDRCHRLLISRYRLSVARLWPSLRGSVGLKSPAFTRKRARSL